MKTRLAILTAFIFSCLLFSQDDYICWEKYYGNEVDDGATSVIQLSNGNYAVAGYYGFMLSEDWYTMYCQLNYLDPLGNIIWELWYADETRGGTFVDIVESDDGCIIAIKNTLMSAVDGWQYGTELFKIDLDRNILWNKLYTHGESMSAEDLTKTADGGYAVCGDCDINDSLRVGIVMKFDQNGDSLWTTTVRNDGYSPLLEGHFNHLNSIVSTNTKEIVCVGYNSDRNGADGWIVKLDENGDELFNIDLVDSLVGDLFSSVVYNFEDNTVTVVGNKIIKTKSHTDLTLTKFNSDCEMQWQKRYGYLPESWEDPFDICKTSDGGCIITGSTKDNTRTLLIMKFDSEGDSLWSRNYFPDVNPSVYGNSIQQSSDGGYIVCGTGSHDYYSTGTDMWVLKLDPEGLITDIWEDENIVNTFELYQNYPNPFNPVTEIRFILKYDADVKLTVFNTKGEIVKELIKNKMGKGLHSVNLDAASMNSGVYFYKLDVSGKSQTKKMVVAK